MEQKILYIENNKMWFKKLVTILKDEYTIIPHSDDEFKIMKKNINSGNIEAYVKEKIEDNCNELRLIICDLELVPGNKYGGSKLIQYIRNNIELQSMKMLPRLIPIIVLSNYSFDVSAQDALDNGATHNIHKDFLDKIWVKDIIKSMINYYRHAYIDRTDDDLMKVLKEVSSKLEGSKRIIKSGFGDLKFLIENSHEETLTKFDLLTKILFSSFTKDTQQKIFNSFKKELESVLTEEAIKDIQQGTWDNIKTAIKEVNNGGGFKEFVNSTYDILSGEGILDGKGKLIGIAIKGIFNIMAS